MQCLKSCPNNKFGHNCEETCSTCNNGGVCSSIDGSCSCAPGWTGERCNEPSCKEGFYGPTCSKVIIINTFFNFFLFIEIIFLFNLKSHDKKKYQKNIIPLTLKSVKFSHRKKFFT